MKSLNDSLRDEFNDILQREEYKKIIEEKNLDLNILKKAFDTLLKYKSDADMIDKSKTEFENFAGVLERAQKKVNDASNELDKLVGVRTRQIQKHLKNIETLDSNVANEILEIED